MEKFNNDTITHKEKPHRTESKKHKESLRNKLLEKQRIINEAQELQLRLKIETQIVILTKTFDNFNENLKDNLAVRNWTSILAKWVDLLTFNIVKRWLDEGLENSMQTYSKLTSKTLEFLKTSKLTEEEQQKISNILKKFSEHISKTYSEEKDINTESLVKITKELDKNLEFIEEWRNNTYAFVKKVNKDFMPNFDCLYISSKKYWVPAELLVAVMQNDSSLGKHLASENNFWNVWNTDSWNRVGFDTPQEWIDAVARNIKKRMDKFEKYVKDRYPTVIEILTGKISWMKKTFYWKYMSNPMWPKRVASIYNKLTETKYVGMEEDDNDV